MTRFIKFCDHIDSTSTVSSFLISMISQYESLYNINLICSVKSYFIKTNTKCLFLFYSMQGYGMLLERRTQRVYS